MTGFGRERICLYIQHIQAGNTVCSDVTAVTFYVHIASAAEGFIACSGQNHYVDIPALTAVIQGITDFGGCSRGECVAVTRTVDGDFCYSVIEIEKYVLILFDGFPFSCFHYSCLFMYFFCEFTVRAVCPYESILTHSHDRIIHLAYF